MSSFDSYGEFKIIIARVEFNTLPYHICIIILIVNNIIPVHGGKAIPLSLNEA